nr:MULTISPECIES: hypothetical protein [unclassified Allomuricauda]
MRIKTTLYFVCVWSLVLFTNCKNDSKSKANPLNAKETLAQLDSLAIQIEALENEKCENLDTIVILNEKMRRIIENIRSINEFDDLVNSFDQDRQQIGLTVSEDGKFGVFTWQSKMDCLGIHIKNIALYKTDGRVYTSSLYGEPLVCHEITNKTINTDKTVYLLRGSSSTNISDSLIKTYTISNGDLVEARISSP